MSWVTAYSSPSDYGRDSDLPPEVLALQEGLSRDPSVSKVWLTPKDPRNKYYKQQQ